MFIGFAWLIALLIVWFDIRHPGRQTSLGQTPAPKLGVMDGVAMALILVAHFPLSVLFPDWARLPGFLPGDARSHALVAQHLTLESLGAGWSDRYVGGFPLGTHYPMVGWLLLALPMRFGFDPTQVVHAVSISALMAAPLVVYVLGRLNHIGITSCIAAALSWVWVSPLNPFLGGHETYCVLGLVSQVMVMPQILAWAGLCCGRSGSCAWPALLAGLSFMTHPQIAAAATILLGIVVFASLQRQAIRRYLISGAVAGIAALLVYGPAAMQLQLPFGWPMSIKWLQIGFGPERLEAWVFGGELLDRHRLPILTSMWLVGLTLSAARIRAPSARAVIAASVGALCLSTIGPSVVHAGRFGQALLTVLQPLRSMALIPISVAATIMVGLELHRGTFVRISKWVVAPPIPKRLLRQLKRPSQGRCDKEIDRESVMPLAVAVSVMGIPMALVAMQSRLAAAREWSTALAPFTSSTTCGPHGPNSLEMKRLMRTLGALSNARLWFDDSEGALPGLCAQTSGFERASGVAIANTVGVGAHVGLLTIASRQLAPAAPGADRRAEALGIRYILTTQPSSTASTPGFKSLGNFGDLRLAVLDRNSGLFGTGCVRERWSGTNAELESALRSEIVDASRRDSLLDPSRLVELAIDAGPLSRTQISDECQAKHVTLVNATHAVGRHSVEADLAAPGEILLRVTAHPSWHWYVDGHEVPPQLVSPGYYAVRVETGHHQILVTHRLGLATISGWLFVLLAPVLLGLRRAQLAARDLWMQKNR